LSKWGWTLTFCVLPKRAVSYVQFMMGVERNVNLIDDIDVLVDESGSANTVFDSTRYT